MRTQKRRQKRPKAAPARAADAIKAALTLSDMVLQRSKTASIRLWTHQGKVDVKADDGHGARFRIVLPRRKEAA